MKPVMNMKTLKFFVELEKEFRFLSCDLIGQDDLFEIQDRILSAMVEASNDNTTGFGVKILSTCPYLFKTEVSK